MVSFILVSEPVASNDTVDWRSFHARPSVDVVRKDSAVHLAYPGGAYTDTMTYLQTDVSGVLAAH